MKKLIGIILVLMSAQASAEQYPSHEDLVMGFAAVGMCITEYEKANETVNLARIKSYAVGISEIATERLINESREMHAEMLSITTKEQRLKICDAMLSAMSEGV